jgi:integral membrane protein (TIGR01906 family)
MDKKTREKAILCISVGAAVYLILATSFFLVLFDKGMYDKAYSKYGAYEKVGVEGIRYTTDNLLQYITGENSNIAHYDLNVFSAKEQDHLKDVHWVIRIVKYLTIISLAWLAWITYSKLKTHEGKTFLHKTLLYTAYSGVITIMILAILGINFTWFFEMFHKIFFPQGNYSFPATSLLIIMFPEGFFRDFAIKIIIHSMVLFALCYFIATRINWISDKKPDK